MKGKKIGIIGLGNIGSKMAAYARAKNRKIAGAAVDVFEQEPLPADHPFRHLDNVLATPHIGYVTEDTYRLFYQDTAKAIMEWLG